MSRFEKNIDGLYGRNGRDGQFRRITGTGVSVSLGVSTLYVPAVPLVAYQVRSPFISDMNSFISRNWRYTEAKRT